MKVTRRTFLRAGVAGAAGLGAASTYGFVWERHRIGVTRAALPVAGLPRALRDLRIGLVSDLHHSVFVSQDDIREAVGLLMAERPHLVALLGDYVTWSDRTYLAPCMEALEGLSAPYGVFAVLGNHDDERTTPRALAARGFEVLADDRTDLTVAGESLAMIGLRFWSRKATGLLERLTGRARGPAVLLAHDPRRLPDAVRARVPVMLSGHTHGGQIVLPLMGAMAARKFPIAAGILRRDHTTLFVSRGIGTVFLPVRLNCPPEVAVLTLTGMDAGVRNQESGIRSQESGVRSQEALTSES